MPIPLYIRILGWFFLNLLLLLVVGLAFLRLPLQWGLDALMAGQAGVRLDSYNEYILSELRNLPRSSWDARLANLEAGAGVRLALFRLNGQQIAGQLMDLPPEVRQRLIQFRPVPPQPRRGEEPSRPGKKPPRPNDRLPPPQDEPPQQSPGPWPGQDHPVANREGPPNLLLLHAGHPRAYWVLARSPLAETRPGGQLCLVVLSPTLSAHGLILDYQPWLLAGGGVIGLSLIIWLPFVGGLTRSITRLTKVTGEIAAGHFDTRVPVKRSDEIGMLGEAVNRMAERIAGQLQGQKRFLGDTAHELVSPLARMEMALGILDQRASEKDRPYLADVREEVRHMSSLVHELLSFSKASLSAKSVQLKPLLLLELVEQTIQRDEITNVQVEIEPTLTVLAETSLLQRTVGNILRNTQKYAGHAGPIEVKARRIGKNIQLTISDSGPGVSDWALPRLFDPFFRVDASRDRETGGTGLGLAIAKTSLEACGGTLTARNRKPTGLEMEIVLGAG